MSIEQTPLAQDFAGVREYVGARYVPVFAEPLEWSSETAYEPLTIVTNQGNSYTSAQYVPVGVDILNTDYWKLTGNYNAQIQAYRDEVLAFDGRITNLEEKDTLIVMGDSWSDTTPSTTTYTKWPVLFANKTKLNIVNYARNGSTLSRQLNQFTPNGDLLGQVNAAINDSSFDHSKVHMIVIMGGVNDLRENITANQFNNGFMNTVYTLQNAFPETPIVFCCNYQIMVTKNDWTWQCNVVRYANSKGIPSYTMLGWVAFANHIADRIHPDNNGYLQIVSNMQKIIEGGGSLTYSVDKWSKSVTSGSNTLTVVIEHVFDNCELSGYAQFQTTEAVTNMSTLGSFSFTDTDGLLTSIIPFTGLFNVGTGQPSNLVLVSSNTTSRSSDSCKLIGTGTLPASGNLGAMYPVGE